VADFGLSKVLDALSVLPGTKTITGTPQYMAPEVMLTQPQGMKVDIYSAAIVMWEILTGAIPWKGMDIVQIIHQVRVDKHTHTHTHPLVGDHPGEAWISCRSCPRGSICRWAHKGRKGTLERMDARSHTTRYYMDLLIHMRILYSLVCVYNLLNLLYIYILYAHVLILALALALALALSRARSLTPGDTRGKSDTKAPTRAPASRGTSRALVAAWLRAAHA
jgi:serine/threonine protein kinase